jgi:hypothetical protein
MENIHFFNFFVKELSLQYLRKLFDKENIVCYHRFQQYSFNDRSNKRGQ